MEVHEPAVAYGKEYFSPDEYLEIENTSVEKNEYYKGEIFAMSGTKVPHNIIAVNFNLKTLSNHHGCCNCLMNSFLPIASFSPYQNSYLPD